jgi:hypothetical protein
VGWVVIRSVFFLWHWGLNSGFCTLYVGILPLEPHLHPIFSVLKNVHTDFHSGCTSLYSHLLCRRVPFSRNPQQHLLVFVFLVTAILTRIRWALSVILICTDIMSKDIKYFFTYFCPFVVLWEEVNEFAHLFIGFLCFVLSFKKIFTYSIINHVCNE